MMLRVRNCLAIWLVIGSTTASFAADPAPAPAANPAPATAATPPPAAAPPAAVPALPPFHERLDQLIESSHAGVVAPPCTDAEFLRRVYLDLIGEIPSAAEARAFLDDPNPAKRTALIDRLLGSARFNRHMADVFDVMLMERIPERFVTNAEWKAALRDAFEKNMGYDQIVYKLLTADSVDAAKKPWTKFLVNRTSGDTHGLTADVGRILFGRDLQCAQCHDHPNVEHYSQADYYGLQAFLCRTYFDFTGKVGEKADGEVAYQSVFEPEDKGTMKPRMPGGERMEEPSPNPADLYEVKPEQGMAKPKFSRREQLARLATSGRNKAFNRNIANRLWAHMMGRGVVDPLDLHHDDNPPINPELLDLLSSQVVAMKFDIRGYLRELALTRTYQRSIDMPADLPARVDAAAKELATLETEIPKLEAAMTEASKTVETSESELKTARRLHTAKEGEQKNVQQSEGAARQAAEAANKTLADANGQLAAKQQQAQAVAELLAKTAAAAQLLPGEKDLVDSATALKTAADRAAGEASATSQAAQTAAADAKTKNDALAAASSTHQQIAQAVNAVRQSVMELENRRDGGRDTRESSHARLRMSKRRLDAAKLLVETGRLVATVQQEQQRLAQLQGDLATSKQRLNDLNAQLPTLQAQKAATEKAAGDSAVSRDGIAAETTNRQNAAKVFGELVAQAEATVKVRGDAEIVQTLEKLKARNGALQTELAEWTKKLEGAVATAQANATQLTQLQTGVANAGAEIAALTQKVPTIEAEANTIGASLQKNNGASREKVQAMAEHWERGFGIAVLRPLTPEQLCWSTLKAVGAWDGHRAHVENEKNKTAALTPEQLKDAALVAARVKELDQATYDQYQWMANHYSMLFAGGDGRSAGSFAAAPRQALFLANGDHIKGWMNPGGALIGKLNGIADVKAMADELYLTILTRRPTDAEVAELNQAIAARPNERPIVIQETAWALLTSVEFRFNH